MKLWVARSGESKLHCMCDDLPIVPDCTKCYTTMFGGSGEKKVVTSLAGINLLIVVNDVA